MLALRSLESIDALADPELRRLIRARIHALEEFEDVPLEQLVQLIVVEPGDEVSAVDAQLGFPILSTPAELVDEHAGWFEMVPSVPSWLSTPRALSFKGTVRIRFDLELDAGRRATTVFCMRW